MQEKDPSSSSEDNYLLDHESSESLERPKRQPKKEPKSSQTVEGKWTDEQSIKFALYIDYMPAIFNSKEKRKATKIFVSLAEFLGSRTPRQCRSHFQKLMTKFRKINKIRAHYESILGPLEYARRMHQITALIKKKEAENQPPPKVYRSFQVQTDPMLLKISDLARQEIGKLMLMLQEQLKGPSMPIYEGSGRNIISLSDDNETDPIKREPFE